MYDENKPAESIENPPVHPAPIWTWTGFWSFLLALLERLSVELSVIENPPWWVSLALVGLPFVIRLIRQKTTGLPSSYRRGSRF